NEGDEPYFTQPLMYEAIKLRPQLHALYEMELLSQGFEEDDLKQIEAEVTDQINQQSPRDTAPAESAFLARWSGMKQGVHRGPVETKVAAETLLELSERLSAIPPSFHPHPKVAALLQRRREALLK